MKRITVTADYKAAYTSALILTPGEKVTVGKGDSEWPGWYWCTDDACQSAWVHESFLSAIDSGTAKALKDYSSRELSVQVGDTIAAEYELGGWLLGVDARGEKGWIPARYTDWHE
jgi:hypothetical protein